MTSNEHRQLGQSIVNGRTAQQQPFDIFLHCEILLNGSVACECFLVGNTQKGSYHYTHVAAINVARVLSSPRHAMQSSEWTFY